MTLEVANVSDLRFGFAPLPAPAPGYFPAADAQALMLPSIASPAVAPVAGTQYTGSYATGERFVIRVPAHWNGKLVVAGTPASRCEFSNDLIWGECALAGGYAFATSNKGIPYNAFVEPAATIVDRHTAYPVPFDAGGLLTDALALQFGMLSPRRVPIDRWNDDYRDLVIFARDLLAERHRRPERIYAVGVSNGGAQVRTLLERSPELVDGGVEWSGVYWTPDDSLLDRLPLFLREMPAYIATSFRDRGAVERLVAAGFPPDVVQANAAHPSLYAEFYSNVPPFYADLTVFVYALLIDPLATSNYGVPACVAHPDDPARLPAKCNGTGVATPEGRAAYVPSAEARHAIASFSHDGAIGKPLISIAGTHDAFITPAVHAQGYHAAVVRAGRSAFHELFLVEGGTHVDTFAAFGYGMQAQAPFAWAALDKLARRVEGARALEGGVRPIEHPREIA